MRDLRTSAPRYLYLLVSSSRYAVAPICVTRPVSTEYRFRASVRFVEEAPAKFVVLNMESAGSPVPIPNVIVGTTGLISLIHPLIWVNWNPKLRLCVLWDQ